MSSRCSMAMRCRPRVSLSSLGRCLSTTTTPLHSLSGVESVELAVTRWGDPARDTHTPPLVILHGLFGQKQNWNSVAKRVQQVGGGVVYCADMRNHGDSPRSARMGYTEMAGDVARLCARVAAECGRERVDLLGHSMGGKAAMRAALSEQGARHIDRLVIEDVSPRGYSTNASLFRAYVHAMKNADLSGTRQQVSDQIADKVPLLPVRQFLLTNLAPREEGGMRWKVNLDACEAFLDEVLGFGLKTGSFDRETLFLYGEVSGYVPVSDRPLIRSLFPRVEFESIAGAGHWVHAEKPTEFIDALLKFTMRDRQ